VLPMEQQTQPQIPKVINVLIVLGAIGYVLIIPILILVLILVMRFVVKPVQTPTLPGTTTTMGESGSRCGGSERLPCRPGYVCSVKPDSWSSTYGECVKDTSPTQPVGVLGSSCGGDVGCGPGLKCTMETGSATGTCASVATSTPPALTPKR
jgi:hypothetical protein